MDKKIILNEEERKIQKKYKRKKFWLIFSLFYSIGAWILFISIITSYSNDKNTFIFLLIMAIFFTLLSIILWAFLIKFKNQKIIVSNQNKEKFNIKKYYSTKLKNEKNNRK